MFFERELICVWSSPISLYINMGTIEIQVSVEKQHLLQIGPEVLAHKETNTVEEFHGRCDTSSNSASALPEAKDVSSDTKMSPKHPKIYSIEELLSFRLFNVQEQQKRWSCIYEALGLVARELDELSAGSEQPKKARKSIDRRQRKKKNKETIQEFASSDDPTLSGETSIEPVENDHKDAHPVDCDCDVVVDADENCTTVEYDGDECEDNSDECGSIQRPAFFVPGEPDFESGPPQDGLEYLRRVRWEAMQIPKVKVARLDESKLRVDQTPYMPSIPDIADCPVHLEPSKHWVDTFLADFSEWRQGLAQLQNSNNKPSYSGKSVLSNFQDKDFRLSSKTPLLSAIIALDAVSRALVLRNHVRLLEDSKGLSRGDCEWAFALFLVLDEPLNADTSAAIRSLLRKCASLRASKTAYDDEVVMLNIIITIAAKYFGQSEM